MCILFFRCDLDVWSHGSITRDELLQRVKGVQGIYCMLTEKIDEEVLNNAGTMLIQFILYNHTLN